MVCKTIIFGHASVFSLYLDLKPEREMTEASLNNNKFNSTNKRRCIARIGPGIGAIKLSFDWPLLLEAVLNRHHCYQEKY
jgi:hypothetical protein